eukprot:12911414-Ditylum_brightwellii.AAC.1
MDYANTATAINSADFTMHIDKSVYDCNTQKELIQFYYATILSLIKKTLLEAARQGYLQRWPGFMQVSIRKHIDVENATLKGHLIQ